MDWEPWLKLAHIAGAVVWIGGGLTLSLVGVRARRSADATVIRQFAQTLSFVGLRLFTPSVIIVLVTGILLVLSHSGDFTQLWIVLALTAFAAAFLVGVLFLSRSALALERVSQSGDVAASTAALGTWLRGYAIVLVILAFALWDMVFKPGA